MNNRQLYLAWVRSKYPDAYIKALRTITGKPRSLGGLGDDLVTSALAPDLQTSTNASQVPQDIIDTITVTGTTPSTLPQLATVDTGTFQVPAIENVDNYTPPAITVQPAAVPASGWWDSFTTAVGQITSTLLKSQAQSNLLQVNTQRARQGLPPLTANGVPVTAASLMPANASILAMEQAIAGGGTTSLFLVGLLAVGAFLLFGRK